MRHSNRDRDHGEDSSPVGKTQLQIESLPAIEQYKSERRNADYGDYSLAVDGLAPANRQIVEEPLTAHPVPGQTAEEQEHRVYRPGVNVLLTLERPPAEELAGCDRAERYQVLMAHAEERRTQFQSWAESEGLCDDIMRIGKANSFLVLFVYCTPSVAKRLAGAPGVVDVAIAPSA